MSPSVAAHACPRSTPDNAFAVSPLPPPLVWAELSDRDREVYEVGFLMGFLMREDEVAQANADADRFYRIAFDRRTPQRRRW